MTAVPYRRDQGLATAEDHVYLDHVYLHHVPFQDDHLDPVVFREYIG